MSVLYTILAAICVLGPLVALHEWGHYIVARMCGVKVLTYSIGFGPKIFGWQSRRSGINYQICAIFLGGYVKMLDEREGNVAQADRHLAFNNQHPLKKIAIVAAGPLMNFLIAIGLFWVLFLTPSQQLNTTIGSILPQTPAAISALVVGDRLVSIDHKPVSTWEEVNYALANHMGETKSLTLGIQKPQETTTSQVSVTIEKFMQDGRQDPLTSLGVLPYRPVVEPVIGEIMPQSAAQLMGLQVGDRILSVNGQAVNDWFVVAQLIRQNPEVMLHFEVLRDDHKTQVDIMPRGVKQGGEYIGQIGVKVVQPSDQQIPPQYLQMVEHTPMQALQKAFTKTYDLAQMTLNALSKMVTGLIGLENISGPITIAEVSKASFEIGWQQVLSTAALISLSLAVLNLLPIPILDGGHLVFYTYELIVGRTMPESVQMGALRFGMILLFCFMMLAIGNDIMRIFG